MVCLTNDALSSFERSSYSFITLGALFPAKKSVCAYPFITFCDKNCISHYERRIAHFANLSFSAKGFVMSGIDF